MIPYTYYFNELNSPPEGIDTLSIWINPDIINRIDYFHRTGNIHESINCRWSEERIHKTGQFIRKNYFIDIQAEALNPNADLLGQIIYLLTGFFYAGIIGPFRNTDMTTIAGFFMDNFSNLFAVNNLDFYFDLKEEDCILLGEPNPYPETRYSSDYPSSLKVYSKVSRQLHKNHIPHKTIEQMEYPTRIEFHFANGNCNYLDYRNLQGTSEAVFYRYLPQLARKWFNHRREVVNIPYLYKLSYACHLRQINDMALAGHIPQNKGLIKTPPRPRPEKHYGRNETDLNWLPRFVTG